MTSKRIDTGQERGQPTKLTEDRMKRICDATAAGNTRRAAAQYAGIDISTLQLWLQKGERGEKGYSDFSDAIREAEGKAEVRAVTAWVRAFETDWRACRDWLARRHPSEWGPTQAITGPEGGPIQIAPVVMDEARLRLVYSALDEGQPLDPPVAVNGNGRH